MATSGGDTGIVGCDVQTAVDAKHHLIVAREVTNVGHDRGQLADMAKLAMTAAGEEELIALADRGYHEGYEILACGRAGVAAAVPKPMTWNNLAEGLFDKRDFVCDAMKRTIKILGAGSLMAAMKAQGAGPSPKIHAPRDRGRC